MLPQGKEKKRKENERSTVRPCYNGPRYNGSLVIQARYSKVRLCIHFSPSSGHLLRPWRPTLGKPQYRWCESLIPQQRITLRRRACSGGFPPHHQIPTWDIGGRLGGEVRAFKLVERTWHHGPARRFCTTFQRAPGSDRLGTPALRPPP